MAKAGFSWNQAIFTKVTGSRADKRDQELICMQMARSMSATGKLIRNMATASSPKMMVRSSKVILSTV